MERAEMASLYFLHQISGVGNRTLWRIKKEWGSFQALLEADQGALERSFLPTAVVASIKAGRQKDDMFLALEQTEKEGIKICTVEDEAYPELLTRIYDPPYLFYYLGNLEIGQGFCLGVVGSRTATVYGKVQTRNLSRAIARQGWVVVSGMARGIDTEAHLGALENGGKTIAVLGSGLKVVYPPENKDLYRRIYQDGLVISEFPPLARPEPVHFPQRNRTLAGLCRGVLVVEAKARSGALITADFALDHGRDVFAVPGPINSPTSEGTNNLIRQGACLVTSIEDILTEYGIDSPSIDKSGQGGGSARKIEGDEEVLLNALGNDPLHRDVLQRKLGWASGQLSARLLKLELAGMIRALPGNNYIKT
ncbi:MAG: DNA-protecting protein DprA [Syntrophomonadaceae bacterium]|nr:DNA-protecting protein DprA [Syntrophomonadaceae bacterium]